MEKNKMNGEQIRKIEVVLCKARHSHKETDGLVAVFPQDVNPLDPAGLEREAKARLEQLKVRDGDSVCIYVTGLTVALIAALNACHTMGAEPTLLHYDRDNNCYYPQDVK